MSTLQFTVGDRTMSLDPDLVIVAGFTGRDPRVVEGHLEELAQEGVPSPAQIPAFYALPPISASQGQIIDVLHPGTSGEAEIALIGTEGRTYVTLASDHTDRLAERSDIGMSKQLCPKIFASTAWPQEEVVDHWDSLVLRSWVDEDEGRRLYQEGVAESLLAPDDLLSRLRFARPPSTFVMLCGTVAALGGIRSSGYFWAELHDPVLDRSIKLDYQIRLIDPWASSLGDAEVVVDV